MLKSYISIALRTLARNRVFTLINILGLSIGIACCILISLYIQEEFSYEKGFTDNKRIFRINSTNIQNGTTIKFPNTAPPVAPGLAAELPGIEAATRTMNPPGVEQNIIRYRDKTFFEKDVLLVDSTFFDVFDYSLKLGDRATALDAPSTVVISGNAADRIFGNSDPLGETIIINNGHNADTVMITGVLKAPRFPSHVDADFYMSMDCNGGRWVIDQASWAYNNMVEGFVKLNDPAAYKDLEARFPKVLEQHAGEELRNSGIQKIFSLQPIDDVRLYSSDMRDHGNSITSILLIAIVGLFILLLACINFMNMATARSAQRSGEIGIRKSMGATRGNLVRQFLGESMIIVLFSLLVSFLIAIFVLPYFGSLMQEELALDSTNLPFMVLAGMVLCLFTGIIAGSYPAFFLSAIRPVQALQGGILPGHGSQWLRKGLVVLQFAITISLISTILIIRKQMNYISTKSLGFESEQVLMIPLRTQLASAQYAGLKESFKKLPGVQDVSGTSSLPSTPLISDWIVYKQGTPNNKVIQHYVVLVDRDYFNTMKLTLVAGRDFIIEQDNLEGDTINTPKIIVNEASLKALDIQLADAAGTIILFEVGGERYRFRIMGVVSDFHQFSLHRKIEPMIFMLPGSRRNFNYMAASIDVKDYSNLYTRMKRIWDERVSDTPFEPVLLSANVKKLYSDEARLSVMMKISTIIALIISCLGLYGLSVYIAERRTKEIGIRRVAGASAKSISGKLSWEYIQLVLISLIVSVLVSYYAMSRWLEGFAYRIEVNVLVYAASGVISVLIAWLTVSFETLRAANRNPAEMLRFS